MEVERMREAGKRVFCEYVSSISYIHCNQPLRSTHHRLIVSDAICAPLAIGDLLDDHYNERISYYYMPQNVRVFLRYFDHTCGHDHVDMPKEELDTGAFGLGALDENTWICAFRLCNFRRARLAPRDHWEAVLSLVVRYLAGEEVKLAFPDPVCSHLRDAKVNCAADTDAAVERGLSWLINADILIYQGKLGVREGFLHHINAADGKQLRTKYGLDLELIIGFFSAYFDFVTAVINEKN
jgi:hypothetical protein